MQREYFASNLDRYCTQPTERTPHEVKLKKRFGEMGRFMP